MSEYIIEIPAYVPPFDPLARAATLGEEVVRCRDCKHYTDNEMEYYHYCGNWYEQVDPNGFCAWGERRDA